VSKCFGKLIGVWFCSTNGEGGMEKVECVSLLRRSLAIALDNAHTLLLDFGCFFIGAPTGVIIFGMVLDGRLNVGV
jgi:hypothetical protein